MNRVSPLDLGMSWEGQGVSKVPLFAADFHREAQMNLKL
jgi:hypothetical protein